MEDGILMGSLILYPSDGKASISFSIMILWQKVCDALRLQEKGGHIKKKNYLFIWLCWVLAAADRIFCELLVVACEI